MSQSHCRLATLTVKSQCAAMRDLNTHLNKMSSMVAVIDINHSVMFHSVSRSDGQCNRPNVLAHVQRKQFLALAILL